MDTGYYLKSHPTSNELTDAFHMYHNAECSTQPKGSNIYLVLLKNITVVERLITCLDGGRTTATTLSQGNEQSPR